MEHASMHALRRQQKKCRTFILLHPGALVVAAVVSLFLILICVPHRRAAIGADRSGGFAHRKTGSASRDAAQIFLESKGKPKAAELEVAGSKGDKMGRSKAQAAAGLTETDVEDGVAGTTAKQAKQSAVTGRARMEGLRPGECGLGLCRNGSVSRDDFVFATACHQYNEPTLQAGRSMRQGLRTYISTNYTERPELTYPRVPGETWSYYPDDKVLRSFYEGDTRAALVPFLAYRDLGDTFKWLFYGDDDTIFFVDAAMKLVKDLDPEMPYFLTDHMWFANWNYGYPWHPHWRAPRCLPCHSDTNVSVLRMSMVKACPCTPQAMCGLEGGYDKTLDKRKCTPPRAPTLTFSMHGGAGALISIGMLKAIDFDRMEDCVLREWSTGGDAFITTCLWQAGYGMTDPGVLWHPDGLTRFDPSPRKLIIDHTPYVIPRAAYTISNMLLRAAGACGPGTMCQLESENVISLHLRGRLLTNSSAGAGVLLRGVTRFFHNQLAGKGGRGKDLQDNHYIDGASRNLADRVDGLFKAAVTNLKGVAPHFKEMANSNMSFPADGGASLFLPASAKVTDVDGQAHILLSEDELMKGGAAGIVQTVLEETVKLALELYPPPRAWNAAAAMLEKIMQKTQPGWKVPPQELSPPN